MLPQHVLQSSPIHKGMTCLKHSCFTAARRMTKLPGQANPWVYVYGQISQQRPQAISIIPEAISRLQGEWSELAVDGPSSGGTLDQGTTK